jgi:hypothetical protein
MHKLTCGSPRNRMAMKKSMRLFAAFAVVSSAALAVTVENDIVGEPPIEMIWAGRTDDTRPPTVDFEEMSGWTAEGRGAEVSLAQTREQQLFGRYVGKLVVGKAEPDASVILRLPEPIPVPGGFNAVNFWLYGYAPFLWEWRSGPAMPLTLHVRTEDGEEHRQRVGVMGWTVWNRFTMPSRTKKPRACPVTVS